MKENKITAVVLAAGMGKRMNSPVAKQFLTLMDKPVLYYSLKAFEESSVQDIVLVTGSGQIEYCKENIVEKYKLRKVLRIVEGGQERYDSVFHALKSICQTDYVLIHDGARPFISKELIENMINQVKEYKACILGTPVRETIKVVDSNGIITSTPNRNALWSAQTPQAFEFASILNAYELFYQSMAQKEHAVTDDAMVYETFLKKPVKMIMGEYDNIKITVPEDLGIAEAIINRYCMNKQKK